MYAWLITDALCISILAATDDVKSIQARAARKLTIPGDGSDISLQYLYCDVYYSLEDGESPQHCSQQPGPSWTALRVPIECDSGPPSRRIVSC